MQEGGRKGCWTQPGPWFENPRIRDLTEQRLQNQNECAKARFRDRISCIHHWRTTFNHSYACTDPIILLYISIDCFPFLCHSMKPMSSSRIPGKLQTQQKCFMKCKSSIMLLHSPFCTQGFITWSNLEPSCQHFTTLPSRFEKFPDKSLIWEEVVDITEALEGSDLDLRQEFLKGYTLFWVFVWLDFNPRFYIGRNFSLYVCWTYAQCWSGLPQE